MVKKLPIVMVLATAVMTTVMWSSGATISLTSEYGVDELHPAWLYVGEAVLLGMLLFGMAGWDGCSGGFALILGLELWMVTHAPVMPLNVSTGYMWAHIVSFAVLSLLGLWPTRKPSLW